MCHYCKQELLQHGVTHSSSLMELLSLLIKSVINILNLSRASRPLISKSKWLYLCKRDAKVQMLSGIKTKWSYKCYHVHAVINYSRQNVSSFLSTSFTLGAEFTGKGWRYSPFSIVSLSHENTNYSLWSQNLTFVCTTELHVCPKATTNT